MAILQYILLFVRCANILGYNLLPEQSQQFSSESESPDSLFGWSLLAWHGQTIVGAPGQDGAGAVHACNHTSLQCSEIVLHQDVTLPQSGFFGSALVGDEFDLYACAPLAYLDAYRVSKQTTGICYKEISGTFREFAEFNLKSSGRSRLGNRPTGATQAWYWGGIFGFSATVINEVLYIGVPTQSLKTSDGPVLTGNVVGIDQKDMILTDPLYANFATGVEKIDGDSLLAGETIGKGVFYEEGFQMIVSSVKAESFHGKVFICGECFKDSRARSLLGEKQNIEVVGKHIGERFGKSTVACDLTGDGFDDLLVGAPLGSTSNMNLTLEKFSYTS